MSVEGPRLAPTAQFGRLALNQQTASAVGSTLMRAIASCRAQRKASEEITGDLLRSLNELREFVDQTASATHAARDSLLSTSVVSDIVSPLTVKPSAGTVVSVSAVFDSVSDFRRPITTLKSSATSIQ